MIYFFLIVNISMDQFPTKAFKTFDLHQWLKCELTSDYFRRVSVIGKDKHFLWVHILFSYQPAGMGVIQTWHKMKVHAPVIWQTTWWNFFQVKGRMEWKLSLATKQFLVMEVTSCMDSKSYHKLLPWRTCSTDLNCEIIHMAMLLENSILAECSVNLIE